MDLMATSGMVQWLDVLETSTTGCFREACVGGADSEEAAPIFEQLKQDVRDLRQPALDSNSERLRTQARDLKDQCVQQAKVCQRVIAFRVVSHGWSGPCCCFQFTNHLTVSDSAGQQEAEWCPAS